MSRGDEKTAQWNEDFDGGPCRWSTPGEEDEQYQTKIEADQVVHDPFI